LNFFGHAGRIYGTAKDAVGESTIEGTIDIQRDTVRFVKHYSKKNFSVSYVGSFIPGGIVGEWHYPDGPPKWRHYRGRFAIRLLSDEDAQGDQLQAQLRMLKNEGRTLTRSLTVSPKAT
jgi:hypothetical protein